jgi:hypothetical protein
VHGARAIWTSLDVADVHDVSGVCERAIPTSVTSVTSVDVAMTEKQKREGWDLKDMAHLKQQWNHLVTTEKQTSKNVCALISSTRYLVVKLIGHLQRDFQKNNVESECP